MNAVHIKWSVCCWAETRGHLVPYSTPWYPGQLAVGVGGDGWGLEVGGGGRRRFVEEVGVEGGRRRWVEASTTHTSVSMAWLLVTVLKWVSRMVTVPVSATCPQPQNSATPEKHRMVATSEA